MATTTQVHLLVLSISCPAKCFKRSHLRSMCMSTATGCLFFLERFSSFPLVVGRQALHAQVPRLHQRQSRVPRRERDCTLTLFLTASVSTSSTSPSSSEEEGLHKTPLPRIAGGSFGGGGTGPLHTTRSSTCHSDRRAWVWFYLYNQLDGEFNNSAHRTKMRTFRLHYMLALASACGSLNPCRVPAPRLR